MIYEIKRPDLGKGIIKFAGIISILPKSKSSDQLFSGKWGASILRPVVVENVIDQDLGLSSEGFLEYCEKVSELLEVLKAEHSNLVLMDVRFVSNVSEDVIVNHKHKRDISNISPVLKNLEFSSLNWGENLHNDFKLIDKVTSRVSNLNAFQLEISSGVLDADPTKALRIFEEAIIYSHLSVTGQI